MLSGTTNGRIATEGFRSLEKTTGVPLADLSGSRAGDRISFRDAQVQPRTVLTSPEWSGIEAHGRRYSPFTINVEREKPWHTLSGRMHFYVDHAWMLELGEGLPVFRPPLVQRAIFGVQGAGDGAGRRALTPKYLTPHSKWSIHSEYQDNLHMLTLFRGVDRASGQARRDRQLADPHRHEADAFHRRLRAAVVRVQLLRPDRLPA